MSDTQGIAILGSTGSIGTQTLMVIKAYPSLFHAEVLTANNNAQLLIQQAKEFKPNAVVIVNKKHYNLVKEALIPLDIKVFTGAESLTQVVQMSGIDTVLTATIGISGLQPTISAISAKKKIALANKETLVVAGELVIKLAKQNNVPILPVDSEHSAIFQCLVGEQPSSVEKLILTASGGPFKGMNHVQLSKVTRKQALAHPNWDMGAKITIDSATMMNKGFEIIEARWLFGISDDNIDVVVHPQSIIHSLVQFKDGSVKAQLGLPDMQLPIVYALAFPYRLKTDFRKMDLTEIASLTFEPPDVATFVNLRLAYDAIRMGGNATCVLNAANEISVAAFLANKIKFNDIAVINEKCLEKAHAIQNPSLQDYLQTDKTTRELAISLL